MRFFLASFTIILFGQAIIEIQDHGSMLTAFILVLLSILMGTYILITMLSDIKIHIYNLKYYKVISKTLKAVSLKSIIEGNYQSYRVTSGIINGIIIPARILQKGISISLTPNTESTILFQVFVDLKGEIYSAEASNIQIKKHQNIIKAQFNDHMKSLLTTLDSSTIEKYGTLSLDFKRIYRKGKLYFECTIFDIYDEDKKFKAEGYFEGSKFMQL